MIPEKGNKMECRPIAKIYTLYAVCFVMLLGIESAFLVSAGEIVYLVLGMVFCGLGMLWKWGSWSFMLQWSISPLLLLVGGIFCMLVPTLMLGGVLCLIACVGSVVEEAVLFVQRNRQILLFEGKMLFQKPE